MRQRGLNWGAGIAAATLLYLGCSAPPDAGPTAPPVIVVPVPVPVQVAVTTAPSGSAPNRTAFVVQPVVQVQQANGGGVSQAGIVITASITAGGGTLGGTVTATTSASGAATFADLSIAGTVGARTLTFTAAGLTSATAVVTLTPGSPAMMLANSGDNGSAAAGTAVPSAPSVKIMDVDSNRVSGVVVTFAVASGGGSITRASQSTDANGLATVGAWTLGTVTGSNTLTASAPNLSNLTFSAAAVPGAAARIKLTNAPSVSAANRLPFPAQPVARLEDTFGNAVSLAGTNITAAIASGGGTLGGTVTATTSASGAATFTNLSISGTVGARTLTLSAPGLASATAVVTLTPGSAVMMRANSGDGSSVAAGAAVTSAPSVKVLDADSNGVSGVVVTFAIASGGGSIAGATQATDANGVATSGSWTLGTVAGSNTLAASATSLTGLTFTATGISGAAVRIRLTSAPSVSAANRVPFVIQPVLQLEDMFGNAVSLAGTNVTATISTGGGALGGNATAATSTAGVATFTNLLVSGLVGARTLTFAAPGLTSAMANLTLIPGAASTISVVGGNNGTAVAGSAVSAPPMVKVIDADGNAVGGVAVSFAVTSGGGTITGATQTTDAFGNATLATWTLGTVPGTNTLTATAAPLAGAPITFTASASPLLLPNASSVDSTNVATVGARVALPTGTVATVVSSTASSSAILRLTEVAGSSPTSGADTARHLVAQVTGSASDSTTLRISLLVSEPPPVGQKQWLFVRSADDPPGVGFWYESIPTPPALRSLLVGTDPVSMAFSVTIRTTGTILLYPLRPSLADPSSCTSSRQFEPYPGIPQLVNPVISVVLIHGWQPDVKCAGVTIPGFRNLDDYHPEGGWTAMAAKIHERYPLANVYFVRYSPTAHPGQAGAYVRERIAAMNPGGTTGPVVVIGHSMGGLVARYAVRGDPATRKIAQLITLGTPHLGMQIGDAVSTPTILGNRAFPSQGFASLGTNVVNTDIPLPAEVATFAARGGVPCIADQPPNTSWLRLSWRFLCAATIDSDALVPHASAIPAGRLTDSFVPALPVRGVDHVELPSNTAVIEKVMDWLALLPKIALSTSTISFGAVSGATSPSAQELGIVNAGTGTLSALSVDAITYASGEPTGWLSAALSGTTAPASLTLTASVAGVPSGTHTATVTVRSTAQGVTNSPRPVTVTFVVAPARPTIALSQGTVTFNARADDINPAAQTIEVTNVGTGVLSALSASTFTYGLGQPTGWLSASLSRTTAPATLTLTATTGTLAAGTYTATVPVASTAGGITNSPQSLAINFIVSAPLTPVADTIFLTPAIPSLVSRSGSLLYFILAVTSGNRVIRGVSAMGATVAERTVDGPLGSIGALIAEGDNAYWIGSNAIGFFNDKLLTSTTLAGTPATVTSLATDIGVPDYRSHCLLSDGTHLLFIGQTSPGVYALRRMRLSDREIVDLAPASGTSACALNAGTVYYEDRAGSTLRSVPMAGGVPTTLATGVTYTDGPSLLRVAGGVIILSDGLTIRSVPTTGGSVTTRVTDLLGSAPAVAVVGSVLYVHENATVPQCLRISLLDWSKSTRRNAGCEVVDAANLYWFDRAARDSEGNQGWALLKAPK